ncbi:methyl-accepting chemotaxis protein [Uliginosibacterium paludis]|uniref:Methyl-accepting chemotaxis protein n=1 Tax=Uliginosibacterium paludis TaxID=1615952 RepID=A0ABV2CU89_9RHOO
MSIRSRLISLLLFASVSLLALGGYAAWHARSMANAMGEALRQTITISQMQGSVLEAQVRFKTQVQEWKNILIRGNDKAAFDKYLKQFGDEEQKAGAALDHAAQGMAAVGMDPAPARTARSELDTLGKRYRDALQGFDAADPETGKKVDAAVKGMDRPLTDALGALEKQVSGFVADQAEQHTAESAAVARQASLTMLGGALALLMVFAFAGPHLLRSIMRPLNQLRETMRQAEQNWDLSLRAAVSRDEIGQCGAAFNSMFERFSSVVTDIHQRADALSSHSQKIARHIADISKATASQSSSASGMAASVEEMSVSVSQVSDAADESRKLAEASRSGAESSREAVSRGNAQLQQVATRVGETASVLGELGERSKAIAGIVQTVKEIADQTNLLALNAAIEAARAGEQGRGFAVVADEVRKLAEGTTRSTEEINTVVSLIQESSARAIHDVQAVVQDVASQQLHARQATESIEHIGSAAAQALEASGRIANALREQETASQEIAGEIERIARHSEANFRVADEVVSGTRELHELADALLGSVGRFRT